MEQVTSLVTEHIMTIMVAMLAVTFLSLVAGRVIGKNDKRKRKVVANVTFYGGLIVFSLLFLPQLLGARG